MKLSTLAWNRRCLDTAEIGKGLKQPDALEVFDAQGLDQATSMPEELAAMVKTEIVKWTRVIKAAGIKAE